LGKPINVLETEAVRRCLVHLEEQVKGHAVRLHCDNKTAISYIKKEGGTRSDEITDIVWRILSWCDDKNVALVPVHIAGARNVRADALSRAGVIQKGEWALSDAEFDRIKKQFGPPVLDLMATAENRRTLRFISPYPHEEAEEVDALTWTWPEKDLLYLFPPTTIMSLVVQKMRSLPHVNLILVAPEVPTRAWFPDLLDLAQNGRLQVARQPGTLWQVVPGLEGVQLHENPHLFHLAAWRLRW
jgi:hypothetical protein